MIRNIRPLYRLTTVPKLLPCFVFQYFSKENQSSAFLALSDGTPPMTGGLPSQRASNAENVSMPGNVVSVIEYRDLSDISSFSPPPTSYSQMSYSRKYAISVRKIAIILKVRVFTIYSFHIPWKHSKSCPAWPAEKSWLKSKLDQLHLVAIIRNMLCVTLWCVSALHRTTLGIYIYNTLITPIATKVFSHQFFYGFMFVSCANF